MADAPAYLTSCGDSHVLLEPRDGRLILASDIEIFTSLSAGQRPATTELKANDADANEYRLELLRQLASGQRLELVIKRALTYKQSTYRGKMKNRNSLRFNGKPEALAALAPTWKGQPFLVDHNTHEQAARKGTILSSELGEYKGSPAFYMGFSVVKQDAVQSVLDGTLDRFSIGWFPGGAVMCTAHDVDIRNPKDGCYCWPGDSVDVKGEQREVEYEYHDAEGKELSGVNIPAVKSTKIEDYRAALAAELSLTRRTTIQVPATPKENPMAFARLAAALALTVLDDHQEDAALSAVNGLRQRAATAEQERDVARAELGAATAQLTAARAALAVAGSVRLDAILTDAIRMGKIPATRDAAGTLQQSAMERRFRRLGAEPGGVAQVEAELAELPSIVPVSPAVGAPASTLAAHPPATDLGTAGAPAASLAQIQGVDPQLASEMTKIAAQLGLKVEDMVKYATTGRA